MDKNVAVDLSVVGDAKAVLKGLLEDLSEAKHEAWKEDIARWKAADYRPVDSDEQLKPHQILHTICPDGTIVTDFDYQAMQPIRWQGFLALMYQEKCRPVRF